MMSRVRLITRWNRDKPIVSDFSRNIPLSDEAIRYTTNPQQCKVSAVKANTVSKVECKSAMQCSRWRTQTKRSFHLSQIVQVWQGYQTMRVCTKCYWKLMTSLLPVVYNWCTTTIAYLRYWRKSHLYEIYTVLTGGFQLLLQRKRKGKQQHLVFREWMASSKKPSWCKCI